nr:MAG TPA: hypothetical protein [Caudoviricetes sp.]DAJ00547.1 MAG TPA: hypothetical protein [Caudoviricetes sp.]
MWEQGKIRYLICQLIHQDLAGKNCLMVQLNSGEELISRITPRRYLQM